MSPTRLPVLRPRAPRPLRLNPHAAPGPLTPPRQDSRAPRGPPSPARANQQSFGGRSCRPQPSRLGTSWSAQPSLIRSRPIPAFLLFLHPPLQEKRRLGRGSRQRHKGSVGARSEGRRDCREEEAKEEERAQHSQSHLRREQNGGAGGGPTVRRSRGHSPSAPTLTPARPVRGSPLASLGAGGEGRGAARPTMQSVQRRRRPVAKVKGSGSAAAAAPPCPRARPAPSAAGPSLPRPFFNLTSGFGAKASSKQVPCLRRVAPGAEGRARGGRAPGVGGWREPRGRRLAGQLARDETPRWKRGRARGLRRGRGEGGVCYCFCQ